MRTILRHYLEMVVAMLVGMAAYGASQLVVAVDGTAAELVAMGTWMTVPMLAWMRVRGHFWRECDEMGLSMAVPVAGALVLHGTGAVSDGHALLMLEHVVMFPAMFVVTVLQHRRHMRWRSVTT